MDRCMSEDNCSLFFKMHQKENNRVARVVWT